MDEEDPWWTRPPSPSPRAASPVTGEVAPPEQAAPAVSAPSWGAASVIDVRDRRSPLAPQGRPVGKRPGDTDDERGGTPRAPASAAVTEQLPPVPASGHATAHLNAAPAAEPAGHPAHTAAYPATQAPGYPVTYPGTYPAQHAPGPHGVTGGRWAGVLSRLRPDGAGRLPAPARRSLAVIGAVAALLVIILLVLWAAADRGDPAGSQAGGKESAEPAAVTPGQPADLHRVSATDADKDLRRAQRPEGDVVGAWGWSDDNGRNLLATLREREGGGKVTLRVVHLGKLEGQPRELRLMRDPGLPACGQGDTGFTKDSVRVRDLNDDGIAEVTVGWVTRCGGEDAKSRAKLVLLSNGDKYILRGDGVIGSGRGTHAAEPAESRWPAPFRKTLTAMYEDLYF